MIANVASAFTCFGKELFHSVESVGGSVFRIADNSLVVPPFYNKATTTCKGWKIVDGSFVKRS